MSLFGLKNFSSISTLSCLKKKKKKKKKKRKKRQRFNLTKLMDRKKGFCWMVLLHVNPSWVILCHKQFNNYDLQFYTKNTLDLTVTVIIKRVSKFQIMEKVVWISLALVWEPIKKRNLEFKPAVQHKKLALCWIFSIVEGLGKYKNVRRYSWYRG